MIRLALDRALETETARLVRALPEVLRDVLETMAGELVEAARRGISDVDPRSDGEPALVGLRDNLAARVEDGRRGPRLALTGVGSDKRGISYAKILNVHASGVGKVSRAEKRRRAAARAQERAARVITEEEREKRARDKARREAVKIERAARAMRGDADELARLAAVEKRRAERRAAQRPQQWRIPPRNPMSSRSAEFERRLLDEIVRVVRTRWR